MSKTNRITNNTLGVIIGLVVSVWWIFMGLDLGFPFVAGDEVSYILTIGGYRHTIMTIAALILIPICAREYAPSFLGAIILAIITFALCLAHVTYMLLAAPSGFESQLFGPVVWAIIQIPIVLFSYRARRELITA